jgi:2-keto-3-deoxy-L-rhamnonate aldolase RhmA
MGRPGDIGAPDVQTAIAAFLDAARGRGLPCGIFLPAADLARQAFAAGHALVAVTTDLSMFSAAASELIASVRGPRA